MPSLPKEVLAQILQWCKGGAILQLYKCGDAAFNTKLTSGAVKIMDLQDGYSFSTSRWPRSLSLFSGLEMLRLYRPCASGLQYSRFDLQSFSNTLKYLDLDAEGCMKLVVGLLQANRMNFTLETVKLVDTYLFHPNTSMMIKAMPPSVTDLDLGFAGVARPEFSSPLPSNGNAHLRVRGHYYADRITSYDHGLFSKRTVTYYFDSCPSDRDAYLLKLDSPESLPNFAHIQSLTVPTVNWKQFNAPIWPPTLKSLKCGHKSSKFPFEALASLPRSLEILEVSHSTGPKDTVLLDLGRKALERDENWAQLQSQLLHIAPENWHRHHINPLTIELIRRGGLYGLPLTLKKFSLLGEAPLPLTLPPRLNSLCLGTKLQKMESLMSSLPLTLSKLQLVNLKFRFSDMVSNLASALHPMVRKLVIKDTLEPVQQNDIEALVSLFSSSLEKLSIASTRLSFSSDLNLVLPKLVELELLKVKLDPIIVAHLPSQLRILRIPGFELQDASCLPRTLQRIEVMSISGYSTLMTLPPGLKVLTTIRNCSDDSIPPSVAECTSRQLNSLVFPSQLLWSGFGSYEFEDKNWNANEQLLLNTEDGDGVEEENSSKEAAKSIGTKSRTIGRAYTLHEKYLKDGLHYLVDSRIKHGSDTNDRLLNIAMEWGRYRGRQGKIKDFFTSK